MKVTIHFNEDEEMDEDDIEQFLQEEIENDETLDLHNIESIHSSTDTHPAETKIEVFYPNGKTWEKLFTDISAHEKVHQIVEES